MLNIVCINAGNYQGRGADYVNILHDSVMRNLPAGAVGRFICFSDANDEAAEINPHVISRVLPEPSLMGWWHKLSLFKRGVFAPGNRVLYFDLDTLITGRLDDIVKYDGAFAALRDVYRPDGLQSSVMAWEVGPDAYRIWNQWDRAGRPKIDGGDQAWIEQIVGSAFDRLQDLYPDQFASYKASGGRLPEKASVIFFHGHPRPHEVTTGWVPEVWKVGGLMRAQLDAICNTERDRLLANVRTNSARDLPWLDYAEAHDGQVAIVGGGPSVKDKIDEIRWRQSLGQQVWALNNSASWLLDQGIAVDAQIIVDARPENERFIAEVSEHLLASQCSPGLFDSVPRPWLTVTLWHSNAPGIEAVLKDEKARPVHLIGGGSTVGLSAMVIAYVRGYRKIHLFGFDSSISETDHHVYPQASNDADLIVDVIAGDRKFRAAPWMVQQAQEFVVLAKELADQDCLITVAGEGLLPHMAREMMLNPQPSAAEIRAHVVLSRLPPGPVRGAEIGVFKGAMSRALLDGRPDLSLIMVDSWEGNGAGYEADAGDWHATLTQDAQDGFLEAARRAVAKYGVRAKIARTRSREAAIAVPPRSLDFVFIDADHSYEGVTADVAAWMPKLMPGGLLCGHDYANPDFPKFGVKRAVDEFVAASGLTLELDANLTWFVRILSIAATKAA